MDSETKSGPRETAAALRRWANDHQGGNDDYVFAEVCSRAADELELFADFLGLIRQKMDDPNSPILKPSETAET